jgi:hypothetical protein
MLYVPWNYQLVIKSPHTHTHTSAETETETETKTKGERHIIINFLGRFPVPYMETEKKSQTKK